MIVKPIAVYNVNKLPLKILNVSNGNKNHTAISDRTFDRYPLGYVPHQIHFGMSSPTATFKFPDAIIELKKAADRIPCLYCGKPMTSRNLYDALELLPPKAPGSVDGLFTVLENLGEVLSKEEKVALQLIKSKVQTPSVERQVETGLREKGFEYVPNKKYIRTVINKLRRQEKSFSPVEKSIFEEIKAYHAAHPETTTLSEIMLGLRSKHLPILHANQLNILLEMADMSKNLPEDSRFKVLEKLNEAKAFITNDDLIKPFKRKGFIKSILELKKEIPENEIIQQLLTKARSLPSSSTDVSAFFVKYSEPVTHSNNAEVIQNNLEESLSAAEKSILDEIMRLYGEKYHGKTTQEIINELYPQSVENVNNTKKEVLSEINTNADDISEKIIAQASTLTDELRAMIGEKHAAPSEVRQTLLDKVRKIRELFNEEILKKIQKQAQSMPGRDNPIEALFIEYRSLLESTNSQTKLSREDKQALSQITEYLRQHAQQKISPNTAAQALDLRTQINTDLQNFSQNIRETIRAIITESKSLHSSQVKSILLNKLQGLKGILNRKSFSNLLSIVEELADDSNSKDALLIEQQKQRKLDKVLDNLVKICDEMISEFESSITRFTQNSINEPRQRNFMAEVNKIQTPINADITKSILAPLCKFINDNSESLQETADRIAPEFQRQLTEKQNFVLNELMRTIEDIISKFKENVVQTTRQINNTEPRNLLYRKLRSITTPLSDKYNGILMSPLSKVPQPRENLDAFILKYSTIGVKTKNNQSTTFRERTDNEIAQALLIRSLASVEHIHPKELFYDLEDANSEGNLGLVHQCCNEAKSNKLLSDYSEDELKVFGQSAQKTIDEIISLINKRELKKCNQYPAAIRETLFRETNGKINLDISRLRKKD